MGIIPIIFFATVFMIIVVLYFFTSRRKKDGEVGKGRRLREPPSRGKEQTL